MSSSDYLFLRPDGFGRWNVQDKKGNIYGKGKSTDEAIQDARGQTDKDIHLTDAIYYVKEHPDGLLDDWFDVANALAELSGMRIRFYVNAENRCKYEIMEAKI